jgi:branched-subunit amino acid transport protein
LPQWLIDWLDLIPVAILSALLAPILLADTAARAFQLGKLELLVAVPTLLFALKTRSLGRNGSCKHAALLAGRNGLLNP